MLCIEWIKSANKKKKSQNKSNEERKKALMAVNSCIVYWENVKTDKIGLFLLY